MASTQVRAQGRPRYEVADIFRQYGDVYRREHKMSWKQYRVMRAIERCRTAELGGHVEACDECGVMRIAYNSCGDRHCPKCKAWARVEWLEKRRQELLPIPYYHVVFTLDHAFIPLIRCNQRELYNLFFSCVARILKEAGEKDLGGEIGILTILHTWGQTLSEHPHIHCLVTGGALSGEGEWRPAGSRYLFAAEEVSVAFRRAYCAGVRALWRQGKLKLEGECAELAEERVFEAVVGESESKAWQVYIQAPFGDGETTLSYIGRYMNRVGMSNYRLLAVDEGRVRFVYRDYRREGEEKEMSLAAREYIRRYLLHVLPAGFVRIRYYGLWHPSCRPKLETVRRQLQREKQRKQAVSQRYLVEIFYQLSGIRLGRCPACGEGQMVYQYELKPQRVGSWLVAIEVRRGQAEARV